MKIIHQSGLDKKRWDALVEQNRGGIFSFSWYLDACAQDWCVLVDEDLQNGIALPYVSQLGIKSVYPPVFMRNQEFIGSDVAFRQAAPMLIVQHFSAGQLQIIDLLPLPHSIQRVFQQITGTNTLNKQAKRMVQKARKAGLEIRKTSDWKGIYDIICQELTEKISEFNAENLKRLSTLVSQLKTAGKLHCYGIFDGEKLCGGMLFMQQGDRITYLKGAAIPTARDAGGMYLCMETAISAALTANQTFDFGGSSIEGVRRFNQNLGGTDVVYQQYVWNDAPWWFKIVKSTYHLFRK